MTALVVMVSAAATASSVSLPRHTPAEVRFDASAAAEARRQLLRLPAATRLFQAGDYDGSAAAFREILESLPNAHEAATAAALLGLADAAEYRRLRSKVESNLGLCHLRARRFQQSLALLQESIVTDPGAAKPRVHQGLALMHLKRYPEARDAFEEGLERGARGDKLQLDLGTALLRSGDVVAAREVLMRCLRLAEGRRQLQSWGTVLEAEKQLAEADLDQGDLRGAEQRLRRILARSPGDPQARYRLGQVVARRGRPAEAARHLYRFRKDAETLAAIQAVLASSPGRVEALWWVADTYRRLGLLHLAEVHYTQLLARNPADHKARTAIDDLRVRARRVSGS